MFFKIGILKISQETAVLESLFNKVAETPTQVFSCEIMKF